MTYRTNNTLISNREMLTELIAVTARRIVGFVLAPLFWVGRMMRKVAGV